MTTSSKLLVQEARHLASRVKAVAKERNELRYRDRMLRRRIESGVEGMLGLHKTWTPDNPPNLCIAVVVALNAVLEDKQVLGEVQRLIKTPGRRQNRSGATIPLNMRS